MIAMMTMIITVTLSSDKMADRNANIANILRHKTASLRIKLGMNNHHADEY